MNRHADSLWVTSSDFHAQHCLHAELKDMSQHLGHCKSQVDQLFMLKGHSKAASQFVASRLISALLILSLVIGAVSLVL